MKLLLVALTLFVGTLNSLTASDGTIREANKAYDEDRHDDVVRLFTELLTREPAPAATDAADYHFKRAYSLFHLKRFDEARTDLFDAMELGHETADSYNLLALVYSENGEPDRAVEYGRRAVELGRIQVPKSLGTYAENLIAYSLEFGGQDPVFIRGQQAIEAGRYVEAEASFTEALNANPDGAQVLACHLRRGLARLELGKPFDAQQDFHRAIEHGGESANTLNSLGLAFSAFGNDIAAYEHFYNAFLRSDAHGDRKIFKENVAATSRKLSAQADVLHARAQAALRDRDFAAAHSLYARAMLLPGGRSLEFLGGLLALCDTQIAAFEADLSPLAELGRTGTPEAILVEFERLKQLHPHNTRLDVVRDDAFDTRLQAGFPKASALLGKAQNVPYGDGKKAIKYLNEATKLAPGIPVLYLHRASRFTELKDPQALHDIDTAVRLLGGESAATHTRRAEFYLKTGDTARAYENLEAALKINPDASRSWESSVRDFIQKQRKNEPPANDVTGVRSARQRAFDLARVTPGSEASDLYTGLAYTNTNASSLVSPEASDAQNSRAFADFCWAIILDPLNGNAYHGRAYCYDRENDLNAAFADFTRARNVGHPDGNEGINMIWKKKASASIDAWLKAGGDSTATAASGDASNPSSSGSRYCMRCAATGSTYVYEDDTDAYNHRVRVEKRKPCPECNGRGIR